jgi:hypothetical protein
MIYDKINDFCKVRNNGNCFKNGPDPTPRVRFLMDLLDSEGIEYDLDAFEQKGKQYSFNEWGRKIDSGLEENEPKNMFFNIIMRGSSNKMIVAHHDVNNHTTDNANDNSASVINVIATKKLRPELNAILLDGEEFGGIGSERVSTQIKGGEFGEIEWVLNYELSGKGGEYFFIGDYPGKLFDKIKRIFNCPVVKTPFNDAVIFRKYGIDSVVINPIPPLPEGKTSSVIAPDGRYLDISILYNCHSPKDTISTISPTDMREFVEKVILKIV